MVGNGASWYPAWYTLQLLSMPMPMIVNLLQTLKIKEWDFILHVLVYLCMDSWTIGHFRRMKGNSHFVNKQNALIFLLSSTNINRFYFNWCTIFNSYKVDIWQGSTPINNLMHVIVGIVHVWKWLQHYQCAPNRIISICNAFLW